MSLLLPGTAGNFVNFGSGESLDDLLVFTKIVVAQPVTLGVGCGLVAKGTSGTNSRRSLEVDAANGILVAVDTAGTLADNYSGAGVLTTAWQFIAATWDHADIGVRGPRLYHGSYGVGRIAVREIVGGGGAGSVGDPSSNAALNQHVGAYGGGTGPANWRFAFVGIWDRVLTLSDFRAAQRCMLPPDGSSRLWAPFGVNRSATTVPDYSGFGNVGTATGAAVDSQWPSGFSLQGPGRRGLLALHNG